MTGHPSPVARTAISTPYLPTWPIGVDLPRQMLTSPAWSKFENEGIQVQSQIWLERGIRDFNDHRRQLCDPLLLGHAFGRGKPKEKR